MEQTCEQLSSTNVLFDDNNILSFTSIADVTVLLGKLHPDKMNFVYLGLQDYNKAWQLQKHIHTLNKEGKICDVVLFLEHPNVYTFGKNADKNFLLEAHPDADVIQTDRGGQVTYHGPGQLVGYPIVDLNNYKKSITWFMHSLEKVIIDSLRYYDIESTVKKGFPGVWVDDEKICAMGVRIARWVTMHGFALNVDPDMRYFDGMIPCGILDHGVTSIYEQIHRTIDNKELVKVISSQFRKVFNKDEL